MVKVLVSEWARRAARELDDWRDRWLASKEKDIYADGLLRRINIKGEVIHAEALATAETAKRYYKLAMEDRHTLEEYLVLMKGWRLQGEWKIESRQVSSREYYSHRSAVVAELHYKQRLVSAAKEAIAEHNTNLSKEDRRYRSTPLAGRSPFSNREERLLSLNQHFVDAAESLLDRETFNLVLSEAKNRLRTFEEEFSEIKKGQP